MPISYLTTQQDTPLEKDETLSQYFNHDIVILPFFFYPIHSKPTFLNHHHIIKTNPQTQTPEALCGCNASRRCALVSIKVLDNQVDLFDRQGREDESKLFLKINTWYFVDDDISNCVLHMMDVAS